MRAADDQRVLVAAGEVAERRPQPLLPGDQQVGGVTELHGQRGVPHVVGCQPDVDEARVGAELLLEAGEQRDHLVLHAVLDLEDAADVDAGLLPDAGQGVGRDAPTARVGLAHRKLDTQPGRVLRLLAPDPPHGWTRVPLDHALTLVQNLEGWKGEPAAATRL